MTIHQFLALFATVKETHKGWDVCCPAHDDRSPSLGLMEGAGGRIVLNCFAGCTPGDICTALGLTMADLFLDSPGGSQGPSRPSRITPKPVKKRTLAFAFELHALDLRRQADTILAAAAHCEDCDTWTHEDIDLAMQAVSRAYAYQERAQFCESYADHVRECDYELKRLTPREPSISGTTDRA